MEGKVADPCRSVMWPCESPVPSTIGDVEDDRKNESEKPLERVVFPISAESDCEICCASLARGLVKVGVGNSVTRGGADSMLSWSLWILLLSFKQLTLRVTRRWPFCDDRVLNGTAESCLIEGFAETSNNNGVYETVLPVSGSRL